MQRRQFSLAAATAATSMALGTSSVWAQAAAFQEGKEYLRLSKPAATEAPAGKVEHKAM